MIYNEIDQSQSTNNGDPENLFQSRNSNQKINSLAYLLSQTLWIIYIFIFIGSGFLFQRYHPSNIYQSAPIESSWNTSKDPIILTHSSDIHVSVMEPEKVVSSRSLVYSLKFYKASYNFITGDIVNSYDKKNPPKVGHQVAADWIKWRSIVEEETNTTEFKIIDLPGNHDMFSIDTATSPHNLFLNYSFAYTRNNTKNARDIYIKKIKVCNLTVLLICPIRFPTPAPPYVYWVHPTRKMLDELEEEIDNITDPKFYIFSHYPVDIFWWVKSSRGHSYEEIMHNKRIIAYFSGHFHPKTVQIIHHGQGAIEFIAPAAFQFKKFSIITIDNNRLVYHVIDLTSPPSKYLLTNPVPIDQISSNTIFSEQDTELRVLSYDNNPDKNTVLTVSGAVNGVMKYSRTLPNGADLYTFPLHIEKEGIYTINITGKKCQISRQFYFGKKFTSKKDVSCCYQRGLLFVKIASIPIFLCLFIILFPFNCFYSNVFQMINKDIESNTLDVKQWILIIFLSPFILQKRISRLPNSIRYMLFFFLFYPLFFPQNFFKNIYGIHGCPILCFIIIGNNVFYDEWAIHMTMFFFLLVLMPAVFILSSVKLYYQRHWIFYINCCIDVVFLIGVSVINMRFVGESDIVPNLFINPTFVIIPIIIHLSGYLKIFINENYIDFSEQMDNVLTYTK